MRCFIDDFATNIDAYSRKAKVLIENHNKSQPLFLYVAFQAPHGPINEPPAKYLQLYSSADRARLARWDENANNRAGTISVGNKHCRFSTLKYLKIKGFGCWSWSNR